MRDASQNSEVLEKKLKGFQDLLSVAQVVVSSLDLDEVLQNILLSAMTIVDMPAGTVALYDEASASLRIHAHSGLSNKFVSHDRWPVEPDGLTRRILDYGEPFQIGDTETAGFAMNPLVREEGIRALIGVPLKMQQKIVGILYLDDFNPRDFTEDQLGILSILASFASMSIDNARLHQRTLELACTDGLTGLYNHRQFKKLFQDEITRAIRYRKPLSIIFLDVDDFKKFNDTHGHPKGDVVLQKLAVLLRVLLRDCDTIFRYGGEEFVMLLPETEPGDAIQAAERIRAVVEAESPGFFDRHPAVGGVTVSVGVASFPRDGSDVDTLLHVVDQLMYQAKHKGKNKVHCREEG